MLNTVKPLNSGQLRVLKNLSVIKRCLLLGDNLTKIVIFVTRHFVRYSRHVHYLGCLLLGGFTVFASSKVSKLKKRMYLDIVTHLSKDEIKKTWRSSLQAFWKWVNIQSNQLRHHYLLNHQSIWITCMVTPFKKNLLIFWIIQAQYLYQRHFWQIITRKFAGKTNKEIHNIIVNKKGMIKCNCRS